jgi:uncharacterized protein YjbI with pentapeptide repeats
VLLTFGEGTSMKLSRRLLGAACLSLLVSGTAGAQQPDTCPHSGEWIPKKEELQQILSEHAQWTEQVKPWMWAQSLDRDPETVLPKWAEESPGRANLCNARLEDVKLNDANLAGAQLNNAKLIGIELNKADLRYAELNGALLSFAHLREADLRSAKLNKARLTGADLNNAVLKRAELKDADLGADSIISVPAAVLSNADMSGARLNKARLFQAELRGANLNSAHLSSANLAESNLDQAELSGADLEDANLESTSLAGAQLDNVNLTNATYAPASAPPDAYLAGIKGLHTVHFPAGQETGLVQLRELLQKAGLRELERQATFAIEHGKTRHGLSRDDAGDVAEGILRTIAFDWTTAYGLYPARALKLLMALLLLLIPVYFWPIRLAPNRSSAGIYQVWPSERIEMDGSKAAVSKSSDVNQLQRGTIAALGYAAYFSLLSAFHIGWRDLNVGTWIARVQPREYALRAVGWVRVVSGIQSLLSVYLLAIWALTYFGRPFQ